jgi:branched-chain amino acid aminotransferase
MQVWCRGEVVPAEKVRVPLDDSAFEHGLGLFETMRAAGGEARWLDLHIARMTLSAEVLGLPPIPTHELPTHHAVALLLDATARTEGVIRITRTGGGAEGPVLWMKVIDFPPPMPTAGARLAVAPWRVDAADPLSRHKCLNYWLRRLAFDSAKVQGADEALMLDGQGYAWEGSRTNLFVVSHGRVITPPVEGPIVPGICRRHVVELAIALGLAVEERPIGPADWRAIDEVFLTNSVRGIIGVDTVFMPDAWRSRGASPITAKLRKALEGPGG